MDETIRAMRSVIAGLPGGFGETRSEPAYVPIAAARRPAGLPDVGDILAALPDGVAPFLLSKAVHEAGHAAVAMACGMSVDGVFRKADVDLGDGVRLRGFTCELSGPASYDATSVFAAGLLAEIQVWGEDAYWEGAFDDYLQMASARNRRGPLRRGAAALMRASGLAVPGSLRPQVTVESLIEARDAIPDRSLALSVEAFPDTLRIAALLAGRFDAGAARVEGAEIELAAREPWLPGMDR